MRIIILKNIKGKRWKLGDNIDVHPSYGQVLVMKKQAYEIPEYFNQKFYLAGVESREMVTLQRMNKEIPVTIAQLEHYLEKINKVSKTPSVKKNNKK